MSDVADFEKAYDKAVADKKIKKLVIDIRGNLGGDGAVLDGILSVMVPKGDFLYSTDDRTSKEEVYSAGKYQGKGKKFKGDLFILTDNNSASCSDILTGVMKNYGAKQVGEATYGKGVGQYVYPLHNGYIAAITGLYVNIRNLGYFHGTPIEPDVFKQTNSFTSTKLADGKSPLSDKYTPITSKSTSKRIKDYQQHLINITQLDIELTGKLDARTMAITNGILSIAGMPDCEDGVINSEAVARIGNIIGFTGVYRALKPTAKDLALQYCIDYERPEWMKAA
jgi:C-terminal processing protease CtpA/Prc